MKTPTPTTKRGLLAASLLSIALAVPVAVAGAQPDAEPAAEQIAETARPTPATLTVTATVAPGQCQPVAGGPAPVTVTDTAQEPPAPDVVPVASAEHVDGEPTPNATGAGTSRFDPYTCAPVPPLTAEGESTGTTAAASPLQDAPAEVIPSYTPTLNPYPGGSGGISAGGATDSADPLSEPTTTVTIPPAAERTPTPATTTTAVVSPAR